MLVDVGVLDMLALHLSKTFTEKITLIEILMEVNTNGNTIQKHKESFFSDKYRFFAMKLFALCFFPL